MAVKRRKQSKARNAIKEKSRIRIISLILLVVIAVFSLPILLFPKNDTLAVELIGNETQYLSINSSFLDPGFKIILNEEEVDLRDVDYSIEENIDPNVLGPYEVIYDIKFNDKNYRLKREINVVDQEAPVINVLTEEVEVYYCNKENKINLNYSAIDNYDGVLTDNVELLQLDDKIVLSVADSSNNKSVVEIPIIYTEEPSPIINLNGNKTIYLVKGSEYIEEGVSISDGCGKKISDEVVIEGVVDVQTIGEYHLKYHVTSSTGKSAYNERIVYVYDPVNTNQIKPNKDKVIALTFDDGPGQYTEELLNILNKYNVKATFFVTNQFKKYIPLIKREYDEGHVVAVHTLTHKWSIYQSVETYVKDFNDMNDIIYQYTNERSRIFRFPGGSSNRVSKRYAKGVVSAIRNRMIQQGYVYFDWNVDSEDAAGATKDQVYRNVIAGIKNRKYSVVLMHDIKKSTLYAIEDIINYALANGYTFETLNVNSPTVHHGINN